MKKQQQYWLTIDKECIGSIFPVCWGEIRSIPSNCCRQSTTAHTASQGWRQPLKASDVLTIQYRADDTHVYTIHVCICIDNTVCMICVQGMYWQWNDSPGVGWCWSSVVWHLTATPISLRFLFSEFFPFVSSSSPNGRVSHPLSMSSLLSSPFLSTIFCVRLHLANTHGPLILSLYILMLFSLHPISLNILHFLYFHFSFYQLWHLTTSPHIAWGKFWWILVLEERLAELIWTSWDLGGNPSISEIQYFDGREIVGEVSLGSSKFNILCIFESPMLRSILLALLTKGGTWYWKLVSPTQYKLTDPNSLLDGLSLPLTSIEQNSLSDIFELVLFLHNSW